MIIKSEYSGKTYEEALTKCLEDQKVLEKDLYIEQDIEEGKLFKAPKVTLKVVSKRDVIIYLKSFIEQLGKLMNIQISSEIKFEEDVIKILLVSDNNAILIGKEGRTLQSIQIIIRQTINNILNQQIKINVDASNYRAKKQNYLEYEIKKICKEVSKSGIEVSLDPMNSYDRRIVHNVVSKFEDLESKSEGTTPNRFVVIKKK
jgi:spoIIIJ-associated protein